MAAPAMRAVAVEVYLHHETERVVRVSLTGNRVNSVRLPKRAIEIRPHPSGNASFRTITLIHWQPLANAVNG